MQKLPTLEFVISLAREMGAAILPLFSGEKSESDTQGQDLHIKADILSETIIAERIQEKFPGHHILAEESYRETRQEAEALWVVDPLDGTINFSQGIPLWAISVGFMFRGEVILGVVFCPALREMFSAEKGKGAFLNGKKIQVSAKQELLRAVVGVDYSNVADNAKDDLMRLTSLVEAKEVRATMILRSSAVALSWVACGRLDAFFHSTISPWDMAAASLFVNEAGGKVTRLRRKEWDIFSGEILAGTPAIHQKLFERFQRSSV